MEEKMTNARNIIFHAILENVLEIQNKKHLFWLLY